MIENHYNFTPKSSLNKKYNKIPKNLIFLFCLFLFVSFNQLSAVTIKNFSPDFQEIQNQLRTRIELISMDQGLKIKDNLIYSTVILPKFYENRGYNPAWIEMNGINSEVDSLIAVIRYCDLEGLNPKDYHLDILNECYSFIISKDPKKGKVTSSLLADFDILLTDAFLIVGSHFLGGRIDPETIDPEWSVFRRDADLNLVLKKALENNSVKNSLKELLPQHQQYTGLRRMLINFKNISKQNNLVPLSFPECPKPGEVSHEIASLKVRLNILGDLSDLNSDTSNLFDANLTQALKSYQKRNGLPETGLADKQTLDNLNIPIKERINQIKINMERWRWLPENLGTKYVLVNIANFELDVIKDNNIVLNKRVVVGKSYRKTPVFSDKITYIVLNPYWNVPQSLAVQDILPKIKLDKSYLAKQNMRIYIGWGSGAKEVSADSINWKAINEKNFNFNIRQDSGPNNALGKCIFRFPNKYNVYIHDSPAQELYQENVRTFSSGCIRLQKPLELVYYLLKDDTSWDVKKNQSILNEKKDFTISLKNPTPIHIVYLTAWIDEQGNIQFRPDVYDRDKAVSEALAENPPED